VWYSINQNNLLDHTSAIPLEIWASIHTSCYFDNHLIRKEVKLVLKSDATILATTLPVSKDFPLLLFLHTWCWLHANAIRFWIVFSNLYKFLTSIPTWCGSSWDSGISSRAGTLTRIANGLATWVAVGFAITCWRSWPADCEDCDRVDVLGPAPEPFPPPDVLGIARKSNE